jgi:hypothetical protein
MFFWKVTSFTILQNFIKKKSINYSTHIRYILKKKLLLEKN